MMCQIYNIFETFSIGITPKLLDRVNQNCASKIMSAAPYLMNQNIHTSAVQERGGYPCWKMKKDARIRKTIKEHAFERLNINTMRKNNILPPELKEICDKEIAAFPTDSSITRAHKRCMITSRPRGLVNRYRLSRIVWRHNADYNLLYGYTRARW